MKDDKFIELLNLYLDHEISAEDAVRLEAEVQRDPTRRQVYRDYCRLHKACTLLAKDATIEAPAQTEFDSVPRGWFPNLYASAGLMAAAACAVFVFINRNPEVNGSHDLTNQGTTVADVSTPAAVVNPVNDLSVVAAAPAAARNLPRTVTVSTRQDGFQPVALRTLQLDEHQGSTETVQDMRLTWMEQVQLSSLPSVPVETLRFETKSPLKTNPRHFDSSSQDTVESAAWQFQR